MKPTLPPILVLIKLTTFIFKSAKLQWLDFFFNFLLVSWLEMINNTQEYTTTTTTISQSPKSPKKPEIKRKKKKLKYFFLFFERNTIVGCGFAWKKGRRYFQPLRSIFLFFFLSGGYVMIILNTIHVTVFSQIKIFWFLKIEKEVDGTLWKRQRG